MTTFDILSPPELRKFIAALKKAQQGQVVRKSLQRAFREIGKPVVDDLKREVLAIDVRGVKGHGTHRREAAEAARVLRGKRTRRGGHGLRVTLARAAKMRVTLTGKRVGLRIFMDPKVMPFSQRNLPKHLDNPKGWRHPVWGNREVWVRQIGSPYFRITVVRHNTRVRNAARAAVNEALKELQK